MKKTLWEEVETIANNDPKIKALNQEYLKMDIDKAIEKVQKRIRSQYYIIAQTTEKYKPVLIAKLVGGSTELIDVKLVIRFGVTTNTLAVIEYSCVMMGKTSVEKQSYTDFAAFDTSIDTIINEVNNLGKIAIEANANLINAKMRDASLKKTLKA